MSRTPQNEIKVSRVGFVGIVEIDRAPLNFFDVTLIDTLVAQMQALDADPDCRAIVLAAAGKVFCAGADFGGGVDPEEGLKMAEALYGNALRLFEIATPIVAAVQGPAIGGAWAGTYRRFPHCQRGIALFGQFCRAGHALWFRN